MIDRTSNLGRAALTRREAIQRALTCGFAAAALPGSVVASAEGAPAVESAFKPEDDYPFFGFEPRPIE